ncbi:hypothetical protein, partial, partial [Absidia glauca]
MRLDTEEHIAIQPQEHIAIQPRPCTCGSTTHFRASSRLCPLNPANEFLSNPNPVIDAASEVLRPNSCRCGSTSHMRITSRNCPLNSMADAASE